MGKEGTPVGSTSGPQCHSAYKKLPPREPNLEAQLDEITMRWFDCFSETLPSVTTLARDVCLGEEFSGREYQEWNCWNGTHLGRCVCVCVCVCLGLEMGVLWMALLCSSMCVGNCCTRWEEKAC